MGVVLLLAAPLPAGTIRDDVPDSEYITLANETRYASVGKFGWLQSGLQYLASGILINNQWVLTAAHVVDEFNPGITRTMTYTINGMTYGASATYYHSSWIGDLSEGYDIGLVKLDAVVSNISPAILYDSADENHKITTIAGYGKTGTGLTGAVLSAGTKRAGTNVIGLGNVLNSISWTSGGNDTLIVADFDQPGTMGDPTTNLAVTTDLEYCAAPGDSGGGWFIDEAGNTYLAGITSFLINNPLNMEDSMYGDICGATRISNYLGWIAGYTHYILASDVRGDCDRDGDVDATDLATLGINWSPSGTDKTWTQGDFSGDGNVDATDLADLGLNWSPSGYAMPEPGTLALLALGGIAILRRRQ
ncbi:MAG: trypsin-like serine protease [Planctomycetes bacterium]|nr:trypsin-like serine protease [Planctomycetota bacterium]